jgi:hypothetical protein
VVAAVGLGACGGVDEVAMRTLAARYVEARVRGDYPAMHGLLSKVDRIRKPREKFVGEISALYADPRIQAMQRAEVQAFQLEKVELVETGGELSRMTVRYRAPDRARIVALAEPTLAELDSSMIPQGLLESVASELAYDPEALAAGSVEQRRVRAIAHLRRQSEWLAYRNKKTIAVLNDLVARDEVPVTSRAETLWLRNDKGGWKVMLDWDTEQRRARDLLHASAGS